MALWDWLVIAFSGKRVAILGPRGAGKTTMHSWLREGSLPEVYRPTHQATKLGSARRVVESGRRAAKVTLKAGTDVTGDAMNDLTAWRSVIAQSDVTVYLFDASLLLAGDPAQRRQLMRDSGFIGREIADRRRDGRTRRMAFVGTHCDLIDGYVADCSAPEFIALQQRVLALQSLEDARWNVHDALGHDEPPAVILGSLRDPDAASDLSYRVFKQHFEL